MTDASPRKKPTQKRAKATVKAIVEATAHLLVADGFHNLSTNKIAETAGVSIGSLYQYFPNKEAIVSAVIESFAERQMAILAGALADIASDDMETVIREIIRSTFEAKRLEPELSKVLFEELPPIGQVDVMKEWMDNACAVVLVALQMRADDVRPKNLELAAFVLVAACHGITHITVVDRPELLGREELTDETAELVLRYLRPDP